MAHDVFISYSSKDKLTADAVCATLESRGVRCWIAPRDVLPGEEYAAALVNALHSTRLMVLVFSSGANQSPQVLREVERAVSSGLAILPVRIEDVAPSAAMEFYIASRHWLDALTPPIERHLAQLADTVKLLLSRLQEMPKGAEFVSEMDLPALKLTPPAAPVATEATKNIPGAILPIADLFSPQGEVAVQSGAVRAAPAIEVAAPAPVATLPVAPPLVLPPAVAPPVAAAAPHITKILVAPEVLTAAENRVAGFLGAGNRRFTWIAAIAFFLGLFARIILASVSGAMQYGYRTAASTTDMISVAFGSALHSESLAFALFFAAILCTCAALAFRFIPNWVGAAAAGGLGAVLIMQSVYSAESIHFPGPPIYFVLNSWIANASYLAGLAFAARKLRPTLINIFLGAMGGSVLGFLLLIVVSAARGRTASLSATPFAWYFLQDAAFALLFWGITKIGGSERVPQPSEAK